MEVEVVPFYKKAWFGPTVSALIFLIIGIGIGNSSASTKIGDESANYEQVLAKIEEKSKELENINQVISSKDEEIKNKETELNSLKNEVISNQEKLNQIKEFENNKKKLEDQISKLNSEINTKNAEVKSLDVSIASKEKELNNLLGKIKETGEAPITLSAGIYSVGSDLPAGRYKAEPVGNGSNFVVYDSSGRLIVNTILGTGRYDEPEYIFRVTDGATIDTRSRVKLTPVK